MIGESEAYLLPILEGLLAGFPFLVLGFHADNGSEYINYTVANLMISSGSGLTSPSLGTATTLTAGWLLSTFLFRKKERLIFFLAWSLAATNPRRNFFAGCEEVTTEESPAFDRSGIREHG